MRTPAALLAGVTFGALFGMPLVTGDPLLLSLLKRGYVIMLGAALGCQLLAIIASTAGLMKLVAAVDAPSHQYESPVAQLQAELPLEWMACTSNFCAGLLLFTVAVGIRAHISIACPYASKVLVFMFLGVFLSMFEFVNTNAYELTGTAGLLPLTWEYIKLVAGSGSVLHMAALVCMALSFVWFILTIHHFWPVAVASKLVI